MSKQLTGGVTQKKDRREWTIEECRDCYVAFCTEMPLLNTVVCYLCVSLSTTLMAYPPPFAQYCVILDLFVMLTLVMV